MAALVPTLDLQVLTVDRMDTPEIHLLVALERPVTDLARRTSMVHLPPAVSMVPAVNILPDLQEATPAKALHQASILLVPHKISTLLAVVLLLINTLPAAVPHQHSTPQLAVLPDNTHHPISPTTPMELQADLQDLVDRATALPMVRAPMVDALLAPVVRLQRSTTLQALLVRTTRVHTDRHRGTNGMISGGS